MPAAALRLASPTLDLGYPRPQLGPPSWADLGGSWGFAYDDDDRDVRRLVPHRWCHSGARYQVPYPPESASSGIA